MINNNNGKRLKITSLMTTLVLTVFVCAIIVYAVALSVTQVTPADTATNWNGTVEFNCTIINDTYELANVSLYTDFAQGGTYTENTPNASINGSDVDDLDPAAGTSTATFTIDSIADATGMDWACWVNDSQSSAEWSVNFTISVDNANPEVFANVSTVGSAPNATHFTAWTTNNTPAIDWNDTVDVNFFNYTLYIMGNESYSEAGDFNRSDINYSYGLTGLITNSLYDFAAEGTTLADGHWFWMVVAYDGSLVNDSATELQYINMSVEVDGTEGYLEYMVDTTAPTAAEPSNMTADTVYMTNGTPELNWTISTEVNFWNYTIEFSLNDTFATINTTLTVINNGTTTNNSIDSASFELDDTYWWRVITYDLANNSATSASNYSFTIDTTIPTTPTPEYPLNGTNTSDTQPLINWTASTEINFRNYTLELCNNVDCSTVNTSFSVTDAATNSSLDENDYSTVLGEGTYYWRVIAFDLSNNSNTSDVQVFRVDTTAPIIALHYQEDGNNLTTAANALFNYTVTDGTSPIDSCNTTIWNSTNDVVLYFNNETIDTTTTILITDDSNLINGSYHWNVYCNDSAGNAAWNVTLNQTFTLDDTGPTITIETPDDGDGINRTVIFNVTDTGTGAAGVDQKTIAVTLGNGGAASTFNYTNDCSAITNGYRCDYGENGFGTNESASSNQNNTISVAADDLSGVSAIANTSSFIILNDYNYTQSIAAGWNLMSVPFSMTEESTRSNIDDYFMFGEQYVDVVYWYNDSSDAWQYWQLSGADTLTTFEPRKGYWVNATLATSVNLFGDYVTGTPPQPVASLDLSTGWNIIGHYDSAAEDNVDTDDALRGLCGATSGGLCSAGDRNFDALYYYSSGVLTDAFNGDFTGDDIWDRGAGFWVYISTADTYI